MVGEQDTWLVPSQSVALVRASSHPGSHASVPSATEDTRSHPVLHFRVRTGQVASGFQKRVEISDDVMMSSIMLSLKVTSDEKHCKRP